MNYIILDLEATCDKGQFDNEIIEIGAIKLNQNLEEVSRFNKFIKPKENPILTDFCKELTSITQEQVDTAEYFETVIKEFQEWLGEDYFLCSWGFYDKNQFIKDCQRYKIATNWLDNHISIKHQHQNIFKLRKGVGVVRALDMMGLVFEGTHHRGIDDTINITKIFRSIFNRLEFNKVNA